MTQILHRWKCSVQRTHKRVSDRQALCRRPQNLQERISQQRFDGAMGVTNVRIFWRFRDIWLIFIPEAPSKMDLVSRSDLSNRNYTVWRGKFVQRPQPRSTIVSVYSCQRLLLSNLGQPQGMYSSKVAVPMLYRLVVIQSLSSTTIQRSALTFSHKYVIITLRLWYHIFKLTAVRVPVLSKPFWI